MAVFGAMKPSIYILGIIFFMGIILAGFGMMGEFRQSDATFMSDNKTSAFNSTFNRYDELTASVTTIQGSVSTGGTSWGVFGVLNALIGSAWNALLLLFNSFGFMTAVFGGLTLFGIPGWVGALLGLVVIVIIAFAIMSAIFRQEI